MGGFYGSLQFRTDDRDGVLRVLAAVAEQRECRFLCGPAVRGWVAALPSGAGQDERVADEAAARFGGELFWLIVHDDDVFAWRYYRDGKVRDRYWSRPGYFGESQRAAQDRERGHPERIAHLLGDERAVERVRKLLRRGVPSWPEMDRLERFARALGMANAVTSYEDCEAGDHEGVRHWRRFVHVPERVTVDEEARDGGRREEAKRQRAAGLLLAETRVDDPGRTWGAGAPVTLQVRGREVSVQYGVEHPRQAIAHPRGHRLQWRQSELHLFDGPSETPYRTLPIAPRVHDPRIMLFSDTLTPHLGQPSTTAAPLLLALVPEERRALAAARLASILDEKPLTMQRVIALCRLSPLLCGGAAEGIVALLLSGDGELLFCGTTSGLRVFRWQALLDAPDGSLAPRHLSVDVFPSTLDEERSVGYVYGLAFDAAGRRVYFGGMDGMLRAVDISDGEAFDLGLIAGAPVIHSLALVDERTLASWSSPGFGRRGQREERALVSAWDCEALWARRRPMR